MGKIIGVSFLILVLAVLIGPIAYGLYLAFKASIILGVIVLVLEPSPFILGIVGIFNPLVCEKIAAWMHLN